MITVNNKLNSPMTLETSAGPVFLGALASVDVEAISPVYAAIYEASPFIEIITSKERDETEIAKLRSDYADLIGKKAYHGWDEEELQRRIDEALNG